MKTKRRIAIFAFFLTYINLYSQKDFFNYNQIKIDKSINIENKHNSKEYIPTYTISVSEDYFPYAKSFNLTQPKIFNRPKNSSFIPVQVEYYYSLKDSIVRLILYSWDTKNTASHLRDFLEKENDQSKRFDTYNEEFDKIVNLITKDLGKPNPNQGQIIKKQEVGYGEWYERKVIWESKKITTEVLLIWTENKGVLGTYRIRTKIYWPK